VKARVVTGDHLFVERVTYNFRRPERGEIIVFRSEDHPGMTPFTHYIKRLVGLGGDRRAGSATTAIRTSTAWR
jgi:signal peptidase I